MLTVSTSLRSHEDPMRVVESVQVIFPDWDVENIPEKGQFPITRDEVKLTCVGCSPDSFIEALTEQRILDTALDVMSIKLREDVTKFSIGRQAAIAGRVTFILDQEQPIGGTIDVDIECEELDSWIEEVTWHPGRYEVPRKIGDELRMTNSGNVREWFDRNGNPTINKDEY